MMSVVCVKIAGSALEKVGAENLCSVWKYQHSEDLLPCGFCSAMHAVCNTVKGSMSTRTPFLLLRNVKYVLYRNGESVI